MGNEVLVNTTAPGLMASSLCRDQLKMVSLDPPLTYWWTSPQTLPWFSSMDSTQPCLDSVAEHKSRCTLAAHFSICLVQKPTSQWIVEVWCKTQADIGSVLHYFAVWKAECCFKMKLALLQRVHTKPRNWDGVNFFHVTGPQGQKIDPGSFYLLVRE